MSSSSTRASILGTSSCESGSSLIWSSASCGSGGVSRAVVLGSIASGRELPLKRLCAVALLELLARAAPARVVAADVLHLRVHLRLLRDGRRDRPAAAR